MPEGEFGLTPSERHEWAERARSRTGHAEDARRARLIRMLSSGKCSSAIVQALDCNHSYVSRWKERFLSEGLGGLYARRRGRAVAKRRPHWID
jgi:transposase